jgi:hypothetical protein
VKNQRAPGELAKNYPKNFQETDQRTFPLFDAEEPVEAFDFEVTVGGVGPCDFECLFVHGDLFFF